MNPLAHLSPSRLPRLRLCLPRPRGCLSTGQSARAFRSTLACARLLPLLHPPPLPPPPPPPPPSPLPPSPQAQAQVRPRPRQGPLHRHRRHHRPRSLLFLALQLCSPAARRPLTLLRALARDRHSHRALCLALPRDLRGLPQRSLLYRGRVSVLQRRNRQLAPLLLRRPRFLRGRVRIFRCRCLCRFRDLCRLCAPLLEHFRLLLWAHKRHRQRQ